MNSLTTAAKPISVLVVDEEPSILVSIAKILDNNCIRALLARSGSEAVEIAERMYIPIDLVLSNAAILEFENAELIGQLSQIRPGIRHLQMATCVDGAIARIQLMTDRPGEKPAVCEEGLVQSVRKAVNRATARAAGRLQ
jgi:response regulator RpfG family c-di-GMP phosphodiesterase